MAIGTTNISMGNIYGEVNNTLPGGTNVSLQTQSQNAGNTTHTSTISGYTSPGGGITGSPFGMGEFGGYVNTYATTSHTSISADSFESDSNAITAIRWNVQYNSSGNIRVFVTGGDNISPTSGTTVYLITNPAAGYTVRHGTFSHTGDDTPSTLGTISSSASTISTAPASTSIRLLIESGGGYEDFAMVQAAGSGSLIFEKSGSPTFTYSFTYDMTAETEGSGGE
jgi:hypothetical protein